MREKTYELNWMLMLYRAAETEVSFGQIECGQAHQFEYGRCLNSATSKTPEWRGPMGSWGQLRLRLDWVV